MTVNSESEAELIRYGYRHENAKITIAMLLVDAFTMLPMISAIEVLRVANRLSMKPLYRWVLLSEEGGAVQSTCGLCLPSDARLDNAPKIQRALVSGAHEPSHYHSKPLLSWLRRQHDLGVSLGAIDTGSYLLAEAGLLDGVRCTLHWEKLPAFSESYPRARSSSELFVMDQRFFTCAGGTASIDMMLQMVRDDFGAALAARCADTIIHAKLRCGADPQKMDLRFRTGVSHPLMLRSLQLMESNLELPLSIDELASTVNLSKRHLERLFQRHFNTTPARYYLNLRLKRAMSLLQETSMSIIDVAVASGFVSASYFSHSFRQRFGYTPSAARRNENYAGEIS